MSLYKVELSLLHPCPYQVSIPGPSTWKSPGGPESKSSASSMRMLDRIYCQNNVFWGNDPGHSQRAYLVPTVLDAEHSLQYRSVIPGIAVHASVNRLGLNCCPYRFNSKNGYFRRQRIHDTCHVLFNPFPHATNMQWTTLKKINMDKVYNNGSIMIK